MICKGVAVNDDEIQSKAFKVSMLRCSKEIAKGFLTDNPCDIQMV